MPEEFSAYEKRRFEYHSAEFRSLREEVAKRQGARNRLEEFSVIGIVVIYAWLASDRANGNSPNVQAIGWWMPFFIAVTCFFRTKAITKGIDRAASYIKSLEARYCVRGWEHFVEDERGRGTYGGIRDTGIRLWIVLMLATFAISVFRTLGFMT